MTSKEVRSVIDLNKFLNQRVRVKFSGGREGCGHSDSKRNTVLVWTEAATKRMTGVLKGHDAVSNLVLDETEEFLRDPVDPYKLLDQKRSLGLVVARGTAVVLVSPVAGTEEIANPFVDAVS